MTDHLTDKQRIFVSEYLKDFNGTRSAIAAGYSKSSARSQVNAILSNVAVKRYIGKKIHKRINMADIDADFVLKELYECWQADIADIIDAETKEMKDIHDWPPIWRKMVSGIKVKKLYDKGELSGEVVEIATSKKKEFLELIGKHMKVGAFNDNTVNINMDVNITSTERQARITRIMSTAMERKDAGSIENRGTNAISN